MDSFGFIARDWGGYHVHFRVLNLTTYLLRGGAGFPTQKCLLATHEQWANPIHQNIENGLHFIVFKAKLHNGTISNGSILF